jgi:ornithine cyclodeaminase
MNDRDILILGSEDVSEALAGKEIHIIEAISSAYQAHGRNQSSLPHSTFLHFPDNPANRIIALPAYLGGTTGVAGVKWIASFPANIQEGLDRASAVLILNSAQNGRPKAVLESSIISAKRTAASAALAARELMREKVAVAGLVGCGLINFEIVRFMLAVNPDIQQLLIFDLNPSAAAIFQERCAEEFPKLRVEAAADINNVLGGASVISFATTAGTPHVGSLDVCAPGAVVLHVSLRDLAPEVILASDNVVDDVDHVCRAQTSIHLAEQRTGGRQFIRCTLADILNGAAPPRRDEHSTVIFSPFGMGILDLALGELVLQLACQKGNGLLMRSFLPAPWRRRSVAVTA